MHNKNPFLKEEILNSWFEDIENYNKSKKFSLKKYLSNKSFSDNSNFFTFLKSFMLYNVTHFTKFSIIILAFLVLITGGLTAQAIAPENLKPSTAIENVKNKLFTANKQKDKDPYTALAPDENNYVANLEECDLAFKFPKKVDGQDVVFKKEENPYLNRYEIYKNNIGIDAPIIAIQCALINSESSSDRPNFFLPDDIFNEEYQTVDSKGLRDNLGWFVSESTIDKYSLFKNLTKISFVKGKQQFVISKLAESGLSLNDIQLQFNTLVRNKFSGDINTKELGCLKNLKATATKKELTTYSLQKSQTEESYYFRDKNAIDDYGSVGISCFKDSKENLINSWQLVDEVLKKAEPEIAKNVGTYKEFSPKDVPDFKIIDSKNQITNILMPFSLKNYQKYYYILTKSGLVYNVSLQDFDVIKNTYELTISIE